MGMMVNSNDSDDEVIGTINTTPLVDVMLVLLIIFLITVPVAIHTVPVDLPEERNVPYETKPENIQLAVNKNGDIFWNESYIPDKAILLTRLQAEAQKRPQPEVHVLARLHLSRPRPLHIKIEGESSYGNECWLKSG